MAALILLAVLVTSTISGVLGMAGGMILMAVYLMLLPVPEAMVLHGVTQAASNGFRTYLHRNHIAWIVMAPYALGAALALIFFSIVEFVPERGLVLILVGVFPLAALFMRSLPSLDILNPRVATSSGIIVTAAQLLAGASGPVLDVFYVKSQLGRHAVVATKAFTQTAGHMLKLVYYGLIIQGFGETVPIAAWIYPAVVLVAFGGTRIGAMLLDRLDEERFRSVSRIVIVGVGLACVVRGTWELVMI